MVNTAWLPEQVENVQPGLVEVILVVLTVEQLISSSQLMVTLLLRVTPVAVSVGMVELTWGGVVSPPEGISMVSVVSAWAFVFPESWPTATRTI